MEKTVDMDNEKMRNHKQWINLHNQSRYHPKYPVEEVVQFVFRNYRDNREKKILDAGCGAGRHVKFLADEGYIPYGIDFSESGVAYTKDMLSSLGYEKYAENISCGSIAELPFEDSSFDAIICWGVLCYLSEESIKAAISEFSRVLKSNGKLMLVIRSTADYRYITSSEKNGFYATINEQDCSRNSSSENGMTLFFFEREYIVELFKNIWGEHNIEIERDTKTIENEKYADDNFLIIVTKK